MMNVLLIEGKLGAHTETRSVSLMYLERMYLSPSCCCLYLSVAYLAKQIRTSSRVSSLPCVWTNHVSV